MKETLRVGVAGLGFGAAVHIPGLMSIPGIEIVAIGGRDKNKAVKTAQRLGLDPSVGVSGIDAVIERHPDIVTLALPPEHSASAALKAIEADCAVLAEKPLAANWQEAKMLLEAAQNKSTVTAVDFQFAELPAFQALSRALLEHSIGEVRHVSMIWLTQSYAQSHELWSWKSNAMSGGVLALFGAHVFYLAEWLFGPIKEVWAAFDSSSTKSFTPDGFEAAEDLVHLRLAHESGTIFAATLSNSASGVHRHIWHVAGHKGSLILDNPTSDYMRGFCLTGTGDAKNVRWQDHVEDVGDGRLPPFKSLASRFIARVRDPSQMNVFTPGFEAGARVQYLMEVARQSATTRHPIYVKN